MLRLYHFRQQCLHTQATLWPAGARVWGCDTDHFCSLWWPLAVGRLSQARTRAPTMAHYTANRIRVDGLSQARIRKASAPSAFGVSSGAPCSLRQARARAAPPYCAAVARSPAGLPLLCRPTAGGPTEMGLRAGGNGAHASQCECDERPRPARLDRVAGCHVPREGPQAGRGASGSPTQGTGGAKAGGAGAPAACSGHGARRPRVAVAARRRQHSFVR